MLKFSGLKSQVCRLSAQLKSPISISFNIMFLSRAPSKSRDIFELFSLHHFEPSRLAKEEACLRVIVYISINILITLRPPRETAIIFIKLFATIIWIFQLKVYIKVNNDRLSAAPLEMKSTPLAERCTTRY